MATTHADVFGLATDGHSSLQATDPLEQYRAAAISRWEESIQELEKLDVDSSSRCQHELFSIVCRKSTASY